MTDMSNLRQAAQQALEALERYQVKRQDFDRFADEITVLRAALAEPAQEPVLLECVTCGTVYAEGVPPQVPVQEPFGMPVYASPAPTAEDIAQDWDLLQETQSALRDAWAILKKLKAVQEPQCNPHSRAPHGFMRNASHTENRYVCECEAWDPWEAGYQAGMESALKLQEAEDAEPCRYPDCVDNGPDGKCTRWLLDECGGPPGARE